VFFPLRFLLTLLLIPYRRANLLRGSFLKSHRQIRFLTGESVLISKFLTAERILFPEAEFLEVIVTIWNLGQKSFPPCYSQPPPCTIGFYPAPHPEQSGLKLVCNVNVVKKTSNMRTLQGIPATSTKLYVHEFGFRFLSSEGDFLKNFLFMEAFFPLTFI
jgi:hypothetical protein